VSAASYADAALQTHRTYLAGDLPPEIVSSSPEVVTAWFAGKVPFNFRLPASPPSSGGEDAYRLLGARLVKYRNNDAALVVYEMKGSKISLMVTSDRSAVAAGGDEVQSEGLTFHHRMKNGMNVITWSNHGLTYALVSSVQSSVRGSCLVCHQNMADQNKFTDSESR
jgi:anti-sigma factor RsiW